VPGRGPLRPYPTTRNRSPARLAAPSHVRPGPDPGPGPGEVPGHGSAGQGICSCSSRAPRRRLCDDGSVLDLAVGAEQDDAGAVGARGDDVRLVAVHRDDDLQADELVALVGAALDRRLALAARSEGDTKEVGRRPRAGMVVHGDDPADDEVAHAVNTKRPAALRA